jgi:hypothetical protein
LAAWFGDQHAQGREEPLVGQLLPVAVPRGFVQFGDELLQVALHGGWQLGCLLQGLVYIGGGEQSGTPVGQAGVSKRLIAARNNQSEGAVAVKGEGLLVVAADAAESAIWLQFAGEGAVDVGRRLVGVLDALQGDAHRRTDGGTGDSNAFPNGALTAVGFEAPAQGGISVGCVMRPRAGELLGERFVPAGGEQQFRVRVEAGHQRVGTLQRELGNRAPVLERQREGGDHAARAATPLPMLVKVE